MRILLTNICLCDGTGTETLIRDLSLALRRRGHVVICFAPAIGRIAAQIRATGTPVVQSLAAIAEAPDVIHGHHSGPTMTALARFPDAQAVFVCHDWTSVYDDPPLHPQIGRYLYVRHVLRERLVSEKNIPPDRVQFWGNTTDLTRVDHPKVPPPRPRTAGVYCHPGRMPFLEVLAAACAARGITFLGELLRATDDRNSVERELSRCDLVFASGRMAIEAIAAGCAVINADRFGIGGLVTSSRLDEFLAANFAIGALSTPLAEATSMPVLDSYDAADAAAVTARVRRDCDIAVGAERLEAIYQSILDEAAGAPAARVCESAVFARYLEENFQYGRLYHGEFARRTLTPTPDDELRAMVRKLDRTVEHLSVAIDELAYQTHCLSRRGIGSLFVHVLRAGLKRWRLWRVAPIHFQGDVGARNAPPPDQARVVPATPVVEDPATMKSTRGLP